MCRLKDFKIPDGLIGRFLLDAPFNSPPNRHDDCENFVEFKTLASLAITPNARAQKVQADTEKHAHDLDLKYPVYLVSTSTQVLKSHGKDGRYLVLVVGPFANLSDDFMALCDFLGRARALKAINSWYISPKHALAMNRHMLVPHFGHLVSLVWAKLILGRFRDAVLPDFSRFPAGSDDNLNAFFTDPRHGRCCGRYVPGA